MTRSSFAICNCGKPTLSGQKSHGIPICFECLEYLDRLSKEQAAIADTLPKIKPNNDDKLLASLIGRQQQPKAKGVTV
jgi:hypothetical protein